MPAPLALQIAKTISDAIANGEIGDGEHLSAPKLAVRFGVSRSPIREALEVLSGLGFAEQRANRGYFAKASASEGTASDAARLSLPFEPASAYQKMAEDWLTDRIPSDVTEQMLRDRYQLTKSQLSDILTRAAREGWAQPKAGYGWQFLPVAKTPEAFEQAYRFRMVIEPAAMLEPTYQINRAVLEELKRLQTRMLEQDIERLPGERLMQLGTQFHEELIQFSGNPFFHQSLVRVNQMRRLMEYRSRIDRRRLYTQCREHLELIGILETGDIVAASYRMRQHLAGALRAKTPVVLNDEQTLAVAEK